MTWLRTEQEVDKMIEDMVSRSKGKYITQGVSFNKTCPRQMKLLKYALMSSISFSGLGKEMLAIKFNDISSPQPPQSYIQVQQPEIPRFHEEPIEKTPTITIKSNKKKNVSGFI